MHSRTPYFVNPLMPAALSNTLQQLPGNSDFLQETRAQAERYRCLLTEKEQMEKTGADIAMLSTAISGFRNLQAARIDDYLGETQSSTHWGHKALFTSTSVRGALPDPQYHQNAFVTSDTKLGEKIMRALAIAENAKKLPKLNELRICGPHQPTTYGPVGFQPHLLKMTTEMDPGLKSRLTSLRLDMHAFVCYEHAQAMEQFKFERMLRSMLDDSLRELTVRLDTQFADDISNEEPESLAPTLFQVLQSEPLPHLRQLQVTGRMKCHPDDFVNVIMAHRATLEDIFVGVFRIPEESLLSLDWSLYFAAAKRCPSLQHFSFWVNNLGFMWSTPEEIGKCLDRMVSGTSIEDECDRSFAVRFPHLVGN